MTRIPDPLIPIHTIPRQPKDGDPVWPEDKLCYLVGRNGVFKQVSNAFFTARVPVEGPSHLAAIKEKVCLNVPRLPLRLLKKAEAFFAAVYAQHRSEAAVLLLANPGAEEWRIEVPPQNVRGLHVEYGLSCMPEAPEGFALFGTIHSHANVKAFHSGTDDADEAGFDGLHITIGDLDKPVRSYAARWMLAGCAFPAEMKDVIEPEEPFAFDPAWLEQVRPKTSQYVSHQDVAPKEWGSRDSRWIEDFQSPQEYEQHLLAMREEIDERLMEVTVGMEF